MEIGKVSSIGSISKAFSENEETGNIINSFSQYLMNALNKTNDLKIESDNITEDFAAGRTDNIHEVMIAAEKAGIAMDFTLQIRNKILDAYNEIMRMQI
jgi:flagellar hook-basal body complex protein FliE